MAVTVNPNVFNSTNWQAMGQQGSGTPGGAFWEQAFGPAPSGQQYDVNGQLINRSWWDKLDTTVMSPAGFAAGIGGMALAPAVFGGFNPAYAAGSSGAAAAGGGAASSFAAPFTTGPAWMSAAGVIPSAGMTAGAAGGSLGAALLKYVAPALIGNLFSGGGGGGGGASDMAPTQWPGGGGGSSAMAGGQGSGFFDDPLTQPIMGAWNTRMNQLSQPSPGYGDISAALSQYLNPSPQFNSTIASLQGLANQPGAKNPYTGQYATATTNRMAELNAEPFSASDEAALKARFFDSLALDRDKAYDQVRQEMASRGYAPTSGVGAALNAEVSQGYQKARAGQQQALLQYVTDERNRRRDEAVAMSGQLQQAGGRDAELAQQWQAARANILGGIIQALMQQGNLGLSAGQGMASLRRQGYLDDMSRGDALLQTSALPSALEQQRMALLQNVLSGGNAENQQLFNNFMSWQQQQNLREQVNAQNTGALYGAVGQVAAPVANTLLQHYFPPPQYGGK